MFNDVARKVTSPLQERLPGPDCVPELAEECGEVLDPCDACPGSGFCDTCPGIQPLCARDPACKERIGAHCGNR